MHLDFDGAASGALAAPFDVCIFGTGPAGLSVTLELAKTRKRIALVEAGGLEYTEDSQKLYEGSETGLNNWGALSNKRMRFFGGSSNCWSGRCGLLDEIDFAAETYHGLPGWPIPRKAVLEHLGKLEINDVWVEAGAGLNGALLRAGLIDELIVYMAPRLFGSTARGMFEVPALATLADDYRVTFEDFRKVGADLRITARVSRVPGA